MYKGTAIPKVVVMPFAELSAYVFIWIILLGSTSGISLMFTVSF